MSNVIPQSVVYRMFDYHHMFLHSKVDSCFDFVPLLSLFLQVGTMVLQVKIFKKLYHRLEISSAFSFDYLAILLMYLSAKALNSSYSLYLLWLAGLV